MALAVAFCCAPHAARAQAPSAESPTVPVVIVPGVTGSRLVDRESGVEVWGTASSLFSPKDRGHGLALPIRPQDEAQDTLVPGGTIFHLRLLTWTKEVYRPLRRALEQAGYRLGDIERPDPESSLFFFAYDWRRDNLDTARRLHDQLELLASGRRDSRVHLVCQSSAARVCRYLAKYGGLTLEQAEAKELPRRGYQLTKLVLVGASNAGSMRQLHELHSGRRYVPGVGRFLGPETLFTLRTLFGDLPAHPERLFVDERGRPLDVDLYDPASWTTYGWSVFDPEIERRLNEEPRPELFGDAADRARYLAEVLDRARRVHRVLDLSAEGFDDTRIFLLVNGSGRAPARAQLVPRKAGGWRTLFLDDPSVRDSVDLHALLGAPGDGHATLESQRGLSQQELAAVVAEREASGGHFEVVVSRAAHEAILEFLSAPEPGTKPRSMPTRITRAGANGDEAENP
jgi:hypothetical protein